jgi:hypothetical protein
LNAPGLHVVTDANLLPLRAELVGARRLHDIAANIHRLAAAEPLRGVMTAAG